VPIGGKCLAEDSEGRGGGQCLMMVRSSDLTGVLVTSL